MTHRIAVIPGDGIGPEVMSATRSVVDALGLNLTYEEVTIGLKAITAGGDPLPHVALDSLRHADAILKSPTETPVGTGHRSVNVQLRETLETFANVRPARSLPGVPTRYEGVNLVVIRENLEDLYCGIEFAADSPVASKFRDLVRETVRRKILPDAAIALKTISVRRSTAIAEFAIEHARAHGFHRVTAVHKANILKETDGLFLRSFREVAAAIGGDLVCDDIIVDNCCNQLVQYPERFGVLVCPNLYGDIISDLCAGLVGGLGLAPGANIGSQHAMFEAVHGTAPDIAGQNKANPTALLLSAVMMLDHLNETATARRLETAVLEVLREGTHVTADLHPTAAPPVGTREMADEVIQKIHEET